MNRLVAFAKAIRLKQIVMVFLAGVMLLFNTACSNSAQARMPGNEKMVDRGPRPVGQTQPYVGGMNNFEDTAPEAQQGSSKARALVDNAERNIISNRTQNSPRAKALIDNAGTGISSDSRGTKYYGGSDDSLDRAKNRLGESVKEGTSNVKEEAQKVGDRLSNSLDRAGDKTQELGQRIQKGAENVKDNVQGGIDGTGYNAKRMSETAKHRGEEAGMDLQQTARKVTRAAQDKLSDTADAVKDAID